MVAFRSPKPSVRVRVFLLLQEIEVWCNGSTLDFGSNSSGSNPDTSTEMRLWASGRNHWSAKPIIHRWFESNQALKLWSNRQYGSGKEVLLHFPTRVKCPCGVMDSIPDYGSVGEDSNSSRGTNINISTHSLVG